IAHDQADPRARDFGGGKVEIPADQSGCINAPRLDQPSACAVVPVEKEIDPAADRSKFRAAGLPLVLAGAWDRLIGTAVPSARTHAFDMRSVRACRATGLRIDVVGASVEFGGSSECQYLLVIRIRNVDDLERVSNAVGWARGALALSLTLRFHR